MATVSRVLFVVAGLVWLAVGVLAPFMSETETGKRTLFGSPSTDTALYGAPPQQVIAQSQPLATYRIIILRSLAGLLVTIGLITVGVAWFGLENRWALGLLTGVGLFVLPYWWIAFGPYRSAGIGLGLFDLPPFMWVPGVLMPVAAAIGWIDRLGVG